MYPLSPRYMSVPVLDILETLSSSIAQIWQLKMVSEQGRIVRLLIYSNTIAFQYLDLSS